MITKIVFQADATLDATHHAIKIGFTRKNENYNVLFHKKIVIGVVDTGEKRLVIHII